MKRAWSFESWANRAHADLFMLSYFTTHCQRINGGFRVQSIAGWAPCLLLLRCCCPRRSGGSFLHGQQHYLEHVVLGGGFAGPDFELAGSLGDENFYAV